MKTRLLSSLVLLCAGSSALAADRAVEAVHYEAGLGGTFYDIDVGSAYGSGESRGAMVWLDGAITVPLGQSWGASLAGSYAIGASEHETGVNSSESDTKHAYGATSIFYRNPLGRISVGYEGARTEFSYSVNGGPSISDDTNTSYGYLALAEAYWGPVTIGVNDTRSFDDSGSLYSETEDSIFAAADWYVTSNVRVGAQVGFDDASGVYGVDVEFQPSFLGNMGGIYVAYHRNDDTFFTNNAVHLGFNFYFNKRFDLITRDRHYR